MEKNIPPDFPKNIDEFYQVLQPYYKDERSLDLFFEFYIVDVLGKLPNETANTVNDFSKENSSFFEETNGNWAKYVIKTLHLSKTIDIAIIDFWIKNREHAKNEGFEYHPWDYAVAFRENYIKEGSQVDVWTNETLREAKERASRYK